MFLRILLLISGLVLFTHSRVVQAQNVLEFRNNMMHTDVTLSHEGATRRVSALIDTGCSVCVIDSTFAVDSCHVVYADSNATIGNTLGKRVKSFDFNIDSLSFGGITYPLTRCFVVDLAGKFLHYAPKFIIGGDVLKKEVWCFDLKAKTMARSEVPKKGEAIRLKWKNHDNYRDASLNSIYLKGKIGGKKTRIFFDTGSKVCTVPQTFGLKATCEKEREVADIANRLKKIKGYVSEGVEMELAEQKSLLDFVLDEAEKYPRVNLSFLWGKCFMLDYAHKSLYILEPSAR